MKFKIGDRVYVKYANKGLGTITYKHASEDRDFHLVFDNDSLNFNHGHLKTCGPKCYAHLEAEDMVLVNEKPAYPILNMFLHKRAISWLEDIKKIEESSLTAYKIYSPKKEGELTKCSQNLWK